MPPSCVRRVFGAAPGWYAEPGHWAWDHRISLEQRRRGFFAYPRPLLVAHAAVEIATFERRAATHSGRRVRGRERVEALERDDGRCDVTEQYFTVYTAI